MLSPAIGATALGVPDHPRGHHQRRAFGLNLEVVIEVVLVEELLLEQVVLFKPLQAAQLGVAELDQEVLARGRRTGQPIP